MVAKRDFIKEKIPVVENQPPLYSYLEEIQEKINTSTRVPVPGYWYRTDKSISYRTV